MKKIWFLIAVTMAIAMTVPVTAQTSNTQPTVKTMVRVIPLNPALAGNASYVEWSLPFPDVGDNGVIRVGGDVNTDSGEPLAAWLMGDKWPSHVPLVLGFTPGDGELSLQFSTCIPGQDQNPEPYNDLAKYLVVSEWAVKQGVSVTLWTDDDQSGGVGESQTFDYATLKAAPQVEMLGILVPANIDNMVSLAQSKLADVWSNDMANWGAYVIGWKDSGPARGVGLINAGEFSQSLQVPECTSLGGEYVNDMHKNWVIVRKDQLLATGEQWILLSENDLGDNFGIQVMIDLTNYQSSFLKRIFLPVIYKMW